MRPALALLEFDTIARGIEAGDAMVKRAAVELVVAGTIQPGKYLVLVAGEVADVEESIDAGQTVGGDDIRDMVFLADVHSGVVEGARGSRPAGSGEALGVIETHTVAAVLDAADAALKGAEVTMTELRLGDGLGGKGYALFRGVVSEVQAAVGYGVDRITSDQLVRQAVIAQLDDEMRRNLSADARFRNTIREA